MALPFTVVVLGLSLACLPAARDSGPAPGSPAARCSRSRSARCGRSTPGTCRPTRSSRSWRSHRPRSAGAAEVGVGAASRSSSPARTGRARRRRLPRVPAVPPRLRVVVRGCRALAGKPHGARRLPRRSTASSSSRSPPPCPVDLLLARAGARRRSDGRSAWRSVACRGVLDRACRALPRAASARARRTSLGLAGVGCLALLARRPWQRAGARGARARRRPR